MEIYGLLGYGKCGEDVTRHTSTRIVTDDVKLHKLMAKPLFVKEDELVDEFQEVAGYEVTMNKKMITDTKPVHFSAAILQWSKFLFLE